MSKHNRSTKKTAAAPTAQAGRNRSSAPLPKTDRDNTRINAVAHSKPLSLALLGFLFFFLVCLSSASTVKWTAVCVLVLVIALVFLRGRDLITRLSWPFLALSLLVLLCGISTSYALSGKFALMEFLKLVLGYCIFLLFLLFPGKDVRAGLTGASLIAVSAALTAVISIDLLSTRLLSGLFVGLMELLGNKDYSNLAALEAGVRMTGIFSNPNVLAGCLGLGTLLSLGLVRTVPGGWLRRLHLICLSLCSLGFILAFSMGASAAIVPAFFVYLLLEDREHRTPQLILMIQVLVFSLFSCFPIFLTSFQTWQGPQPIPLLAAAAGAGLLCLSDQMLGSRVSTFLAARDRAFYALIAGALTLSALFAVLALNLTGSAHLQSGQSLRRAAYPDAGLFTLQVDATAPVQVTIESQNEQETMMHTSTILYRGDAAGAQFTIPNDSLVTYFNFHASHTLELNSVTLDSGGQTHSLKLNYTLLPGFIANRLQGLFANENAIQRTVFFRDGLTLFQRSPLVGLGMGSFENAILGVQDFFYETKYVHNHYIQLLLETGVAGLLLFLGVLGTSGCAVLLTRRKAQYPPLTAALGGTLVFMAIHAVSEVVFSASQYLPLALGCFALICLCCGNALALPKAFLQRKRLQLWTTRAISGLLAVFLLLLCGNLLGRSISNRGNGRFFSNMQSALIYDKYEWTDYMLSYVHNSLNQSDTAVVQQALVYAQRLEKVSSNILPLYLGEFYLRLDRTEDAVRVLEKYVNYTASDSRAWNSTFSALLQFRDQVTDREAIHAAIADFYNIFLTWDETHIGSLTLADDIAPVVAQIVQEAG